MTAAAEPPAVAAKAEPAAVEIARKLVARYEAHSAKAGLPETDHDAWINERSELFGRAIGALDCLLLAYDRGELR